MKTFAVKEKRPVPATVGRRPYVHAPLGPVQRAQQARIGRILRSTGAQARLTIGQPNDRYEQEADRVADKVMAMPDPKLQRQPENEDEEETLRTKPLADQITPLVQRQEESPEEEEEPLQAKSWYGETIQRMCPKCEEEKLQTKQKSGDTPQVTPNIESRIHSMKSGGQPLDATTRSFFESRFGRDFSDVRLHTDSSAADTAGSIHARAFTLGNHIAMGSGEYQPNSQSGQRLLGHELTHVIQQGEKRINNDAQLKGGGAHANDLAEIFLQRQVALPVTGSGYASATQCDPGRADEINNALTNAGRWAGRVRVWFETLLGHFRRKITLASELNRPVVVGREIFDAFGLLNRHFSIENTLLSSFPYSASARFSAEQFMDAVRAIEPIRWQFNNFDHSVFTFDCSSGPCPVGRRGSDVLGSAPPGSNMFTIYNNCFDQQHSKTKIGVVLHEAFHARNVSFSHDSYSFEGNYPGSQPLTNAESFATFASFVATGSGYRIINLPAMNVSGRP